MENPSFDDLLQAVRAAYDDARESLRTRLDEALRQRDEKLRERDGQDPALSFDLPRNAGAEGQLDPLLLPLSSFRRPCRPQLAAFALSFDCELREEGFPGAARVFRVVAAAGDGARLWGKKRRRLEIVFHAGEQPCGEVLLDGDVLLPIPASPGPAGESAAQQAGPRLLAWLHRQLRRLWPRPGFAMSLEQSRRVRRLLAQQAAAPRPRGQAAY